MVKLMYLRIRRSGFNALKAILKLTVPSFGWYAFKSKIMLVAKWSLFSSTVTIVDYGLLCGVLRPNPMQRLLL